MDNIAKNLTKYVMCAQLLKLIVETMKIIIKMTQSWLAKFIFLYALHQCRPCLRDISFKSGQWVQSYRTFVNSSLVQPVLYFLAGFPRSLYIAQIHFHQLEVSTYRYIYRILFNGRSRIICQVWGSKTKILTFFSPVIYSKRI